MSANPDAAAPEAAGTTESPLPFDAPDMAQLRNLAQERLRQAAHTGTSTALGTAAMAALMSLALQPQHASAAMMLLQELQVHQIEIEALCEELSLLRKKHDPR